MKVVTKLASFEARLRSFRTKFANVGSKLANFGTGFRKIVVQFASYEAILANIGTKFGKIEAWFVSFEVAIPRIGAKSQPFRPTSTNPAMGRRMRSTMPAELSAFSASAWVWGWSNAGESMSKVSSTAQSYL